MARTFAFPVILHIHTRRLRPSLQGVSPPQPQLPPLAAPAARSGSVTQTSAK